MVPKTDWTGKLAAAAALALFGNPWVSGRAATLAAVAVPPAADEALANDEALRGETLRDEMDAAAAAGTAPSALHFDFGLGLARGESFSAPPLRKAYPETLWSLRFGLGLPFSPLDEGAFGASFDFELDYPLSVRGSEGQNTHRFRFDPALTYTHELLFADDVTTTFRGGVGFGVERVQYARGSIFAYGPLVEGSITAYMDRIALASGWSPFARIPLRYKPPFSKYQTSDGHTDAELSEGPAGRRTGFAENGSFSSVAAGFDVGASGTREADGSRYLVFLGAGYDWHRFSGLRRDFETGRPVKDGASLTRLAVRLGFERGY